MHDTESEAEKVASLSAQFRSAVQAENTSAAQWKYRATRAEDEAAAYHTALETAVAAYRAVLAEALAEAAWRTAFADANGRFRAECAEQAAEAYARYRETIDAASAVYREAKAKADIAVLEAAEAFDATLADSKPHYWGMLKSYRAAVADAEAARLGPPWDEAEEEEECP